MTLAFYSGIDSHGMAQVETKEIPVSIEEYKEFASKVAGYARSKNIKLRDFAIEIGIKPSDFHALRNGHRSELVKFEPLTEKVPECK